MKEIVEKEILKCQQQKELTNEMYDLLEELVDRYSIEHPLTPMVEGHLERVVDMTIKQFEEGLLEKEVMMWDADTDGNGQEYLEQSISCVFTNSIHRGYWG